MIITRKAQPGQAPSDTTKLENSMLTEHEHIKVTCRDKRLYRRPPLVNVEVTDLKARMQKTLQGVWLISPRSGR